MRIKPINKFLRIFLSPSIIGVTLAPFGVYLRKDHMEDKVVINHESIHWKQQKEMLIIFFYIWYFSEWIIRSFYQKGVYRKLLMEREAYDNELNLKYLETRKPYSWLRLKKK